MVDILSLFVFLLTLDTTGSQKQSEAALLVVRVDGLVRHLRPLAQNSRLIPAQ